MTLEERGQKFLALMQQAEILYGITVVPQISSESLGNAILTKATMVFKPIEGWQEQSSNGLVKEKTENA